jgi:hypothetical protein
MRFCFSPRKSETCFQRIATKTEKGALPHHLYLPLKKTTHVQIFKNVLLALN